MLYFVIMIVLNMGYVCLLGFVYVILVIMGKIVVLRLLSFQELVLVLIDIFFVSFLFVL
jgi:hypothetical protein